MASGREDESMRDKLFGWVKETVKDIAKPSADVTGVHLRSMNLNAADLLFDVGIKNPYPIDLPLLDLSYKIKSGASELFSGDLKDLDNVPAAGSRTVKVPVALTFVNVLRTLGGVRPGAVIPYLLEATLSVDPPLLGKIHLPLSKSGELPIPAVPDIDIQSIDWQQLNVHEAKANMQLKIGNKNAFELGLKRVAYDLSLGGAPVVSAALSKPATIARGETGVFDIPISFRPADIGVAIFNILSGRGSGYGLSGSLEVDTPFGPLHLPFDKLGETIFGHSREVDLEDIRTRGLGN